MAESAQDFYLQGLRNQHAVETQVIGTTQNQMPRMKAYPALYAQMQKDHAQSEQQAARLDALLEKHGSSKSALKEVVTGAVGTVAGFVHATASDEVVKNVLAAIGYKAYEIGSYKALIASAEIAGFAEDKAVLETSMKEDMEMGDWLGEHLPGIVGQYLAKA